MEKIMIDLNLTDEVSSLRQPNQVRLFYLNYNYGA
jgi:hypothetical protein